MYVVQSVSKPELCQENLLINELIRDYLRFNQYKYTDSVLVAGEYKYIHRTDHTVVLYYMLTLSPDITWLVAIETGQQKESLERDFLAKQLHIPLSPDHSTEHNM